MKSFLIGLGMGIGLGILFAPTSGEETRNTLQDRATDLANSARKTIEQGREKIQRGVSTIRDEVHSATATESGVRTGTGATGASNP
jgi:gas vesicle protein